MTATVKHDREGYYIDCEGKLIYPPKEMKLKSLRRWFTNFRPESAHVELVYEAKHEY